MKTFRGRPVIPGTVKGEAVVSKRGLNILATFQKAVIMRKKRAVGGDKNNPDIYGVDLTNKILVIPAGIGSTTGGLVLAEVAVMGIAPKAIICAKTVDTLTATGGLLAAWWFDKKIVIIDQVGDEVLDQIKTGDIVSISEDGTITVEEQA